ncbi:MAG: replicative DNA helicase [Clostridium sp.]|nr:replicative DNA helicase [Clostridium sp.]
MDMATPHSIDAEKALLGCVINDKEKIYDVDSLITANDFYYDKHKEIYRAIKELERKNIDIDLITLLDLVNKKNIVKKCGGISYITELSTDAIYNSNIESYAEIVREKSDRRKLIKAGRELVTKSYEDNEIDEIVSEVENSIYQAISKNNDGEIVRISDAVSSVLNKIEKNHLNGGKITGKTTGYKEIDECLSGLQKGDFIVLAARPSMGKTAFSLNIGQYSAKEANVAIFSLEMSKEQLTERLLSSIALVELGKIKTGRLNDNEFGKIALASNELSNRNIFIDDESTSLSDIKAKCRNLKRKSGLDVVMIDYLQLIDVGEKSQSREQEIAKISRELKKLAKKLEITIIALSQLSRAPEQRADHRPMLSDLRESGSIEQDADVIMFLYRDEYYNKETEEKNISEVIVGKNRNGEVKTIKLGWVGQYQRFAPLDYIGGR